VFCGEFEKIGVCERVRDMGLGRLIGLKEIDRFWIPSAQKELRISLSSMGKSKI
jgi:hypothetical protein